MRLSLVIAAYIVSGAMMAACSTTPQGSQALPLGSTGTALAVTRDTGDGPLSCGGKRVGKPKNVMITDSSSKDGLTFVHSLSYSSPPGNIDEYVFCPKSPGKPGKNLTLKFIGPGAKEKNNKYATEDVIVIFGSSYKVNGYSSNNGTGYGFIFSDGEGYGGTVYPPLSNTYTAKGPGATCQGFYVAISRQNFMYLTRGAVIRGSGC